ncbi:MAG: hypothetical protein LUH14_02395 [Clostridiaceae bacterium]|nr:hypothetical protein [Clostridiaceae bacterium]
MGQEKQLVVATINELQENVELFYQQKTEEALQQFDGILAKLATMIDVLFQYKTSHEGFSLDEEKIKGALVEAMNALEERDMVLVADIMQYDFVEYIEGLLGEME